MERHIMAKAQPITGLDSQASIGKNARLIARIRLAEMYKWDAYVDNPAHAQELHDLRIAAKRLRYTLEIFAEVLPDACAAIVQEVTQIQEELGLFHDSIVMIELLQRCLASENKQKETLRLPPVLVNILLNQQVAPTARERYGLEQLLLSQQSQREERYTAFRQHWQQLQAKNFHLEVLRVLK
jgi:CHAD domain-containing protein